jgi:hypothetical protein
MASLTHSTPGIWPRFSLKWLRPIRPADERPTAPDLEDATRVRKDFIHQMMIRNPAAFSSEFDVQNMMSIYSDRF